MNNERYLALGDVPLNAKTNGRRRVKRSNRNRFTVVGANGSAAVKRVGIVKSVYLV